MHATCVALDGRGVLLRGPSGAGKSDLALRLISQPVGLPAGLSAPLLRPVAARLVADDQVIVWPRAGQLIARAPAPLAGKIEVRGLGIIDVTPVAEIAVALVVDLVPPGDVVRLPDDGLCIEIETISLPIMRLAPFEPSAATKLALALARFALK